CRQHPPDDLVHPQTLTAGRARRGEETVRASLSPTRLPCGPVVTRHIARSRRLAISTVVAAAASAACSGPGPGGGGPRDTVPIPAAHPLDVAVVADESRAVTQVVATTGGTLSVTGADGT